MEAPGGRGRKLGGEKEKPIGGGPWARVFYSGREWPFVSEKHFLRKGQGAFEYILVLSGVLLVALVSALILRTTASSGGRSVNESFQTHQEQTRN